MCNDTIKQQKAPKVMNLHEYQAKQQLQKFAIPTPPFEVISSIEQLEGALKRLQTEAVVLKVQVHAGGRGKAGGVKIAKNKSEAKKHAEVLLGMRLVNHQTGKNGVLAEKILLSPFLHQF